MYGMYQVSGPHMQKRRNGNLAIYVTLGPPDQISRPVAKSLGRGGPAVSAPAIQAKWEGLEGIGAGRDALNTQISWEACTRMLF